MTYTAEQIRQAHEANEAEFRQYDGDPRATLSPRVIAELTVNELLGRLERQSTTSRDASDGAPDRTDMAVRGAGI